MAPTNLQSPAAAPEALPARSGSRAWQGLSAPLKGSIRVPLKGSFKGSFNLKGSVKGSGFRGLGV